MHTILNGSERVQPATLKRFSDRFARFNLPGKAVRPAYGMAEATVYIAVRNVGEPPEVVHFDGENYRPARRRSADGSGTPLVSYGRVISRFASSTPIPCVECPEGTVGEIWVHGDHVAAGYWQKPEETAHTFGARLSIRRKARQRVPGCGPEIPASTPRASCSSWAASRTC